MELGSSFADRVVTMTMEEYDHETGETVKNVRLLNLETGEEEERPLTTKKHHPQSIPKTHFKVPTSCYHNTSPPNPAGSDDRGKRSSPKNLLLNNRETGSDSANTYAAAIIFLLPTTVLFYPILSVFLVVVEIALHLWAHKKNKKIRHKNLYYQSPLHLICREFCASCRDEMAKMKITKIQDKRNDKLLKNEWEYFRRIVT